MKSKGVQVIELTEDEKRQFQEATKSTVRWGAKFGPEGSSIIGSPSGNPE